MACRPKRVASQRSKALGVPPRWTWPEDRGARLLAGALLDLLGQPLADAGQPHMAEGVEGLVLEHHVAVLGHGALRDDHDRGVRGPEARGHPGADLVDVEALLGDEDDVGAAGEAGVEGDPAGVPAHHLARRGRACATRRWCAAGRSPRWRCRRRCRSRRCSRWRTGRCRSSWVRRRTGTPYSSVRRAATPRVSSPPIAMSASTSCAARFSWMRRMPFSSLRGLVREEPRMVPPRGRMPRTAGMSRRHAWRPPADRASRPGSRRSRSSYSCTPLRTMARMTALSPGQSPPPVSTPTRMEMSLRRGCLLKATLMVIQVTLGWAGRSIP